MCTAFLQRQRTSSYLQLRLFEIAVKNLSGVYLLLESINKLSITYKQYISLLIFNMAACCVGFDMVDLYCEIQCKNCDPLQVCCLLTCSIQQFFRRPLLSHYRLKSVIKLTNPILQIMLTYNNVMWIKWKKWWCGYTCRNLYQNESSNTSFRGFMGRHKTLFPT